MCVCVCVWGGGVYVCVGVCVCVCGHGGGREEEDEGDPICLFCPPDVSESRLRDLALGWGGCRLKLLSHLHTRLVNTNTPKRSEESRSFHLFEIKKQPRRETDGRRDTVDKMVAWRGGGGEGETVAKSHADAMIPLPVV